MTDVATGYACEHVASPRGVPFVLGSRTGPAATTTARRAATTHQRRLVIEGIKL